MAVVNGVPSAEVIKSKLLAPRVESCKCGPWTFEVTKSHIMGSQCSSPEHCTQNIDDASQLCDLCRYDRIFGDRPLPDMIFPKNKMSIQFGTYGGVEFTALGALQQLRPKDYDNIQVAHAKEWRDARKDCEHTQNIKSGYDWTYTTDYSGTIFGGLTVEPSTQRIDIDKLKTKEPIKFFQELYLYEDELDDNGATNCVVKIRCMDSGFLVLFRHYLRVDHVLVRVLETRLYHETGSNYIIRERVTKGKNMEQLDVGSSVYKCPDQVSQLLDVVKEDIDKIMLPNS